MLVVVTIMAWREVGVAAFVGMAVLVLLLFFNGAYDTSVHMC